MATIRGETARRMRVAPSLDVGQAAILLVAAGLAWAAVRADWPVALRVSAVAVTGTTGALLAVGRWPAGPLGERIPVWLLRLFRHAWIVREAAAGRLARGPQAGVLGAGWIAAPSGRLRVWVCSGMDLASRGSGFREAAEAAYREFLHALDGPLQVVVSARFIDGEDRPAAWDPAKAPPSLHGAATAYAEHWDRLVSAHRVLVRTHLTILRCEGDLADPAVGAVDVEGAFLAFARRIGLDPTRPSGAMLAGAASGARDRSPETDMDPAWSVTAIGRPSG